MRRGDATLFARRDGVEYCWELVTPIIEAWESDSTRDIALYERGSAGPLAADQLIREDGRRWVALS